MLCDYQLKIIEHNFFLLGNNKNIIPNLGNKRKYKLQYQNLKLYLSLELQLEKSNRISKCYYGHII